MWYCPHVVGFSAPRAGSGAVTLERNFDIFLESAEALFYGSWLSPTHANTSAALRPFLSFFLV